MAGQQHRHVQNSHDVKTEAETELYDQPGTAPLQCRKHQIDLAISSCKIAAGIFIGNLL